MTHICHETVSFRCRFEQCSWEIGSAWAKLAGQSEVVGASTEWGRGCIHRVRWWVYSQSEKARLCQGLAVERPWLALEGTFWLKKQAISPQWASISSIQGPFSAMPRVAFPKRKFVNWLVYTCTALLKLFRTYSKYSVYLPWDFQLHDVTSSNVLWR